MSKTLTEAKIAGRAERKRLPIGVHWRGIDPEVHLGYRKGRRGGSWLVRWYLGGAYRQRPLGTADDELSEGTLDFEQAVRAGRELVQAERRKAKAAAAGPVLTVGQAVASYVVGRDARDTEAKGRPTRSDASSRLTRYVTGQPPAGKRLEVPAARLAAVPLHDLSETDLLKWATALPATLKGTTKQRLVNDLKAALNGAYRLNRNHLPEALPGAIKHGLAALPRSSTGGEAVARENQILSDIEVGALITAAREVDADHGWEGDLFRIVVLLAATGARFSQIARLRVGDVQVVGCRIAMPLSRKGNGAKDEAVKVPIGSDVLEVLRPLLIGRPEGAPLLERWRSKQVAGGIKWERVGRGPWQSASEIVRPWAAVRARADLPRAIPYALRHSSIVRGIRANLPIRLVAAMHDTSVAMIERHYGRHIADGLDELAARSVVALVPADVDRSNVIAIGAASRPMMHGRSAG